MGKTSSAKLGPNTLKNARLGPAPLDVQRGFCTCSPGQACLRQILNQKYINWFQSCIIIGTQFMYNFGACKGLARRHQNPETEPHPENVVFAIENASF